jgi:hypothetical protein
MSKFGLTPFEVQENNRRQIYKTFHENREKRWSNVFKKYQSFNKLSKDCPKPSMLFLQIGDNFFMKKFGIDFKANPKVLEFLDNLEIWDNPYEYHSSPDEYGSHPRSRYYHSIYGYNKFNA